jgi:hypothetical protein
MQANYFVCQGYVLPEAVALTHLSVWLQSSSKTENASVWRKSFIEK